MDRAGNRAKISLQIAGTEPRTRTEPNLGWEPKLDEVREKNEGGERNEKWREKTARLLENK